jgi:hypothetical protein
VSTVSVRNVLRRRRSVRLAEMQTAQGVLYDYVMAVMRRQPASVAALWGPGGTLTAATGLYRGRDEIAGYFATHFAADPRARSHIIGPQRVEWVRPGLVRIRSAFSVTAPGPGTLLGWGTYDDRIEVAGEVATFASKTIHVEWLESIG